MTPSPRRSRGGWGCARPGNRTRSEEHTSELQSQSNLVCRLLLEKKKLHPRVALCLADNAPVVLELNRPALPRTAVLTEYRPIEGTGLLQTPRGSAAIEPRPVPLGR